MSNKEKLVDFSSLTEMLYGESKYIKEFADAALISFAEFQENYRTFLLKRDEVNFRKAGHKIKPVAQMLGLGLIIEEYEHAKTLIWETKPESDLKESSKKMDSICVRVCDELRDISESG